MISDERRMENRIIGLLLWGIDFDGISDYLTNSNPTIPTRFSGFKVYNLFQLMLWFSPPPINHILRRNFLLDAKLTAPRLIT